MLPVAELAQGKKMQEKTQGLPGARGGQQPVGKWLASCAGITKITFFLSASPPTHG